MAPQTYPRVLQSVDPGGSEIRHVAQTLTGIGLTGSGGRTRTVRDLRIRCRRIQQFRWHGFSSKSVLGRAGSGNNLAGLLSGLSARRSVPAHECPQSSCPRMYPIATPSAPSCARGALGGRRMHRARRSRCRRRASRGRTLSERQSGPRINRSAPKWHISNAFIVHPRPHGLFVGTMATQCRRQRLAAAMPCGGPIAFGDHLPPGDPTCAGDHTGRTAATRGNQQKHGLRRPHGLWLGHGLPIRAVQRRNDGPTGSQDHFGPEYPVGL